MKGRGLFLSNLPYILWFLFYFGVFLFVVFYFTEDIQISFIIVLASYFVTIPLALSPVGEGLFRFMEGMRPLGTKKEKEYLLPIFYEVYKQVRHTNPKIGKNIQLYISDNLSPNAFALGNDTICVTKGLVESMSAEHLKGLLGHEFGHIVHGDTKALLLTVIGNGAFSISVFSIRLFIKAMLIVAQVVQIEIFTKLIFSLVFLVVLGIQIGVEIGIFLIKQVGDIILMANSRNNEFNADAYSYHIGYGEELISALYEFQDITTNRRMSILERLKSTHPYLADRISRLESKG